MELLDDIDIDHKKAKDWKQIIPLGLLWLGMILSIIGGLGSDINYLLGLSLLIINSIISFRNWKLGIYAQGTSLLLGLVNVVNYFPTTLGIGIELNGIFFGIDLIVLGIAILFYFLSWKPVFPRPEKSTGSKEEQQLARSKVKGFKHRFRHKHQQELQDIANNNRLVPEAIQAAKELLEEE